MADVKRQRGIKGSEAARAYFFAGIVTAFVAGLVSLGWGTLEFDVALACYGFASLFALFALVYRFSMWAQRPPTWQFLVGGVQSLLSPKRMIPRTIYMGKRMVSYFMLNKFVRERGLKRWGAHWPVMIGCIMAASIAFPLVFGWVWFQTPADNFDDYTLMVFGFETITFPTNSLLAFMLFHGLVWATIPVLTGVTVALVRRLEDRGDAATQTFADDFLPLVLLFAISVTGLMLTVSYTWLNGTAFEFLAIAHAICVIFTLLWMPFGKLFHIVQRSVKFTQMAYDYEAQADGMQCCARCGEPFAPKRQIQDLIKVEKQLGYRYSIPVDSDNDERVPKVPDHYQLICPRCRRSMLVLAQGQRIQAAQQELSDPRSAAAVAS